MPRVHHYVSQAGKDVFQDWLDGLRDTKCRIAILRRVDRLAEGNAGDAKFCGNGVWELRVDCGPGYRVYFARMDTSNVLLLGAGPKRSQHGDIELAIARWRQIRDQA